MTQPDKTLRSGKINARVAQGCATQNIRILGKKPYCLDY